MSKPNEARLGAFLRDVSNWEWSQFIKAENDTSYSSNQSMIFALVRSCVMQNLQAIRLSINRLDGKLAVPLRIEYPKIYYLYPNAKLEKSGANREQIVIESETVPVDDRSSSDLIAFESQVDDDLPSLSIRQTVAKMAEYPRKLPQAIADNALLIEQFIKKQGQKPDEDPLVKSVVAAHLLIMAQNRSIDALGEVFDSIDGKLAETFQVLGEDLYITNYSPVAPHNAYVNEDGVMQVEAIASQDMWAVKLGKDISRGE